MIQISLKYRRDWLWNKVSHIVKDSTIPTFRGLVFERLYATMLDNGDPISIKNYLYDE